MRHAQGSLCLVASEWITVADTRSISNRVYMVKVRRVNATISRGTDHLSLASYIVKDTSG